MARQSPTVHWIRRPLLKKLSVDKRHLGLTRREITIIKGLICAVDLLGTGLCRLTSADNIWQIREHFIGVRQSIVTQIFTIMEPSPELNIRRRWHRHVPRTIDSFADDVIPQMFRFRSKGDLRALWEGFQFPAEVTISGHVFYGEEMLLVTLARLHEPRCINDEFFVDTFDLRYSSVSMIFNFVVRWLVHKWGYLLLDNMAYWKPLIPHFAEKIRLKAQTKECPFPSADAEDGFTVFAFLDDTVNAINRVDDELSVQGATDPHNQQLEFCKEQNQRCGINWHTVDLPNGD
jgi:hypothetical protein